MPLKAYPVNKLKRAIIPTLESNDLISYISILGHLIITVLPWIYLSLLSSKDPKTFFTANFSLQ